MQNLNYLISQNTKYILNESTKANKTITKLAMLYKK